MVCIRTDYEKGLTAIELLIVVSILALIIIFAAPMIAGSNRVFDEAIEITESSVEHARKTARFYKTDVVMRLETDEQQKLQSITVSIPQMQNSEALNEVKEAFPLPPGVQVSSAKETIRFDNKGELMMPAELLFKSEQLENQSRQLVIR